MTSDPPSSLRVRGCRTFRRVSLPSPRCLPLAAFTLLPSRCLSPSRSECETDWDPGLELFSYSSFYFRFSIVSCFLFSPISYFLFPISYSYSCFLFPISYSYSCSLFPIPYSYFLFPISYFLLVL